MRAKVGSEDHGLYHCAGSRKCCIERTSLPNHELRTLPHKTCGRKSPAHLCAAGAGQPKPLQDRWVENAFTNPRSLSAAFTATLSNCDPLPFLSLGGCSGSVQKKLSFI